MVDQQVSLWSHPESIRDKSTDAITALVAKGKNEEIIQEIKGVS